MKNATSRLLLTLFLLLASLCYGQKLELNTGWTHATGDFGVDGLEVGTALWFTSRVSVGLNYDTAWDTSKIGTFELTSVGATSVKSHLQNFLVGPRIFFANRKIRKKYSVRPFGELQFGVSHLSTKIQQVGTGEVSSSDTAFDWMVGGGGDFVFSPHWAARANLDFLRTHFAESGQSRLRTVIGVVYTFGRR
jgi:Outer membrane protein beta-barrel domain